MDERPVERSELLAGLPPNRRGDLSGEIAAMLRRVERKIIVLDDDPTGTQTVHGIPVVTRWSVGHLSSELNHPAPASYVLTNSRSLSASRSAALHEEIGTNLREASRRTGRRFALISRSDSTLRGHFPEELIALAAGLGRAFDAWVLCPFFEEGERLTIGDVHYVAEGARLVPAAQTPFAADAAFGYRNSNLRKWVVEKARGSLPEVRIDSLPIEELRAADPSAIRQRIARLNKGDVLIVNAAQRSDLEAAVLGLLEAEAAGRHFLYRTAASLVSVRAAIPHRPLLAAGEVIGQAGRGILIVVGSYVPKTSEQLERLRLADRVAALELRVPDVLDLATRGGAVARAAEEAERQLAGDQVVVVYTSRAVARAASAESLAIGRTISQALVEVVRSIGQRPRILVAKGGITSSDVATEALGVERSIVLGQILPGVPVWKCGPESRFPGVSLVVFPGNVGSPDALADLVRQLRDAVSQQTC